MAGDRLYFDSYLDNVIESHGTVIAEIRSEVTDADDNPVITSIVTMLGESSNRMLTQLRRLPQLHPSAAAHSVGRDLLGGEQKPMSTHLTPHFDDLRSHYMSTTSTGCS